MEEKSMWKKLKNNNKKGFTLVELIVVLVILAILAALLIPALTGYIDKAKEKQVIAEARQTVMATQTLVDEAYAKKAVNETVTVGDNTADVDKADIATLAEVAAANIGDVTIGTKTIGTDNVQCVVTSLVYTNHGKKCTYTAVPATGEDTYKIEAAP